MVASHPEWERSKVNGANAIIGNCRKVIYFRFTGLTLSSL